MNKKIWVGIIVFVAIAVIAVSLFFCIKTDKIKMFDSKNTDLQKSYRVYMEVLDDTVTDTSLRYKLYNNSNENVYYGVAYEIEKYEEGTWKSFGVEMSFIEIAYELEANSSKEESINWEVGYGKLEAGRYRLIKDVMGETVFDEFEIK